MANVQMEELWTSRPPKNFVVLSSLASPCTHLKKSVGGIDDSLWNQLPNLSQGQAIASFTSLTRALQVSRPGKLVGPGLAAAAGSINS